MRWFVLIIILSSLFVSGCFYSESFEKEPVLEQYIIIVAEADNSSSYGIINDNAELAVQ